MKPASFRHLSARSRKRVVRKLCRQWQDLNNEIADLQSEIVEAVAISAYAEAADLRDQRLRLDACIQTLNQTLNQTLQ